MTRPVPQANRLPTPPTLRKAAELTDQVRRCSLDLKTRRYCWLHGTKCLPTHAYHVVLTGPDRGGNQ